MNSAQKVISQMSIEEREVYLATAPNVETEKLSQGEKIDGKIVLVTRWYATIRGVTISDGSGQYLFDEPGNAIEFGEKTLRRWRKELYAKIRFANENMPKDWT